MNGNLLTVRVETAGNGTSVVSLAGELDLSTIPGMETPLLGEVSHRAVIVDLSALSFIDSSGIAVLIKAFMAAEGNLRMHTVIAPGSQVERVLRLAGIDRALPLFVDREAALEALPNGDEEAAAAKEAAEIGGRSGMEDVPEEDRPLAEAGEGESEGYEQAEDLLEERASHEDDRGGPLRDRPDPEEPGGRVGSYGEGDRVDSTETDQDTEPTRTAEEIEKDSAGRDQAEG